MQLQLVQVCVFSANAGVGIVVCFAPVQTGGKEGKHKVLYVVHNEPARPIQTPEVLHEHHQLIDVMCGAMWWPVQC